MNENAIKEVLRSDSRVKELIAGRAHQLYQSRPPEQGSAEEDWYRAEQEVIGELADKLIEAEAESWKMIEQERPALQAARSFAILVGFMLAADGLPTRSDLFDARYYTIGLSYITGMFQIGRLLDEDSFLRQFSNDDAVVRALLYRLRTSPASPYFTEKATQDLKISFNNDEDLSAYLAYAEKEAQMLFEQFKTMLLGRSTTAGD